MAAATRQDGQTFQDRARSAIRAAGLRWTKQRETLLDVIEHAREHLDADGLYRLARERDPRLSLATVYRTLGVLKRQGLVDELHLSEEHHHYEAASADQHFHFVCTSCGAVTEFSAGTVERLRKDLQREHGIVVQSVDLDLAGLCAKCAGA